MIRSVDEAILDF